MFKLFVLNICGAFFLHLIHGNYLEEVNSESIDKQTTYFPNQNDDQKIVILRNFYERVKRQANNNIRGNITYTVFYESDNGSTNQTVIQHGTRNGTTNTIHPGKYRNYQEYNAVNPPTYPILPQHISPLINPTFPSVSYTTAPYSTPTVSYTTAPYSTPTVSYTTAPYPAVSYSSSTVPVHVAVPQVTSGLVYNPHSMTVNSPHHSMAHMSVSVLNNPYSYNSIYPNTPKIRFTYG